MRTAILTLLITFCAIAAQSQTFLDTLRKDAPGQGKVTVTQSAEIDELVNGPERKPATSGGEARHDGGKATAGDKHHKGDNRDKAAADAAGSHIKETTESPADPAADETVVDTRKKVMRNSYKARGYRIQVFSGGNSKVDRIKAETAGAKMKAHFPNEPIYVHFYSPSWKCRMGNYTDLEKAREILAQVKELGYTQASIVKGTISVQY